MINPKDLRLGSLFLQNGVVVEFDSFIAWHISELEPIELTPEWLIKLGFEYNEDWECFAKDHIELHINYDDDGKQSVSEVSNGVQLPSVHTLQNLYHALTGEELTIKPLTF